MGKGWGGGGGEGRERREREREEEKGRVFDEGLQKKQITPADYRVGTFFVLRAQEKRGQKKKVDNRTDYQIYIIFRYIPIAAEGELRLY